MDDRGTGASGGTFKGSTSADFGEDIRAGLAYLRTRPEIRADRLGVLGHSEGAVITPMVAEKEPASAGHRAARRRRRPGTKRVSTFRSRTCTTTTPSSRRKSAPR